MEASPIIFILFLGQFLSSLEPCYFFSQRNMYCCVFFLNLGQCYRNLAIHQGLYNAVSVSVWSNAGHWLR